MARILQPSQKRPKSEWRLQLRGEDSAIFIIEQDDEPVGITCVSVYCDDPSNETAILWGSWLKPEVRGIGLSTMMYESRIGWAKTHSSVKKIIVSHRQSNERSKRANQRFGFKRTTINERTWPDGIREREFHYELNLGAILEMLVAFLVEDGGLSVSRDFDQP